MNGFLVTGHGNFASGILSSMELVAGEQEYVLGVDFLKSYSTQDLKVKLLEAVSALRQGCDSIIILTDLKGGSPFNVSVTLKMEEHQLPIEVISGTNFPMLLSGVFGREGAAVKNLAQSMVEDGQSGIDTFVFSSSEKKVDEEEDGI